MEKGGIILQLVCNLIVILVGIIVCSVAVSKSKVKDDLEKLELSHLTQISEDWSTRPFTELFFMEQQAEPSVVDTELWEQSW
jgi:hypothetical protein